MIGMRAILGPLLLLFGLAASGCGSTATAPDLATVDMGSPADMQAGSSDMTGLDPCAVVRCSAGFVCVAGQCTLDQERPWVLTVTSGAIAAKGPDGLAWDPAGGDPDPFVCLTFNGERRCTTVKADTLAPAWSEPYPAVTAGSLLSGVRIEVWDQDDLDPDDAICAAALVPLTRDHFAAGQWTAACPFGSLKATLRAQ